MALSVIAFCLSCFILLVNSAPQFTNCPTSPSCASVPVSYQCSVEISGSVNSLRWTVLNVTRDSLGFSFFLSNAGVGSSGSIEQFNTEITAAGSPFVSNITFTPTMDIDNYTIECGAASFDGSTTTIVGAVTCPILIEDVLPGIVPNISAINPDNYTISWPPSTSPCLSNYTVNIISTVSDISYGNIPATDTNFVVDISGPLNDTVYSISVAAVDTGGRYMDPVDEISLIIDVPESVTSLTLNQNGLSIDVSWNEPPISARPNISDYMIYHNVPDPDTNITTIIPTPTTTHTISDATAGSVYTVGVAAVNVLGTGPTVSATISISSVPSSTPSMTSSSSTMSSTTPTETPIDTSTSTSSTSPSPTTGSGTGGTDSAVYIGIGAAAAVIVIVILILIIVGCLIWRKPWKGEKANFDQRRDSTEPIALVDKKDHGSSPATGQPIYQEADIQREAAPTTGELYAQPNKSSVRRPPPQPQAELATYQDPTTIQRTQAPTMDYLYAEVDKKQQQQPAVYAQVDKEKKGGDGTVYADLDLKNTSGPVSGNNPTNVIYSDVHNN